MKILNNQVYRQVQFQVRNQLCWKVRDQIRYQCFGQVRDQIQENMKNVFNQHNQT